MGKSVFEQIKKQNGEAFAKAIRNYDNGIFDIPGIVDIVKYAGRDAEPLMNFLVSLKNISVEEQGVYEDPLVLLDKAGYNAYYVTNLEEQNAIKRYYAEGEKLCTFRDPNRFQKYYIINAVKKNVDKIKREDFKGKEKREDEYGTSVLSIQVLKTGGFISIKNRYNHTVLNPDNTFNSNPDNIIHGLSNAIKHKFNVDFSSQSVTLPDGFIQLTSDNQTKIAQSLYEVNNIHFGPDYYIKDGQIHTIDKDKEILVSGFIINLKDKTVRSPAKDLRLDLFIPILEQELAQGKIRLSHTPEGERVISINDTPIITEKNGKITKLCLPTTREIAVQDKNSEQGFLAVPQIASDLTEFSAPHLKTIGDNFLANENSRIGPHIKKLDCPQLVSVGSNFCPTAECEVIDFPNLKHVGGMFLANASGKTKINLPVLEDARLYFLCNCQAESVYLPKLRSVGDYCFDNRFNGGPRRIDVPLLESAGDYFAAMCQNLQDLNAPSLKYVGGYFCVETNVASFNAPQLSTVGDNFMYKTPIKKLNLPSLTMTGSSFMVDSQIEELILPKLYRTTDCFCCNCKNLRSLHIPSLQFTGDAFLNYCNSLKTISAPSLRIADNSFAKKTPALTTLHVPGLTILGDDALLDNTTLKTADFPSLISVGDNFFKHNRNLTSINIPKTQVMGNLCLFEAKLQRLDAPALTDVGAGFLTNDTELRSLNVPVLTNTGSYFLECANNLKLFDAPCLAKVAAWSLTNAKNLEAINIPNVQAIESPCFKNAKNLKLIYAPNVPEFVELVINDTLFKKDSHTGLWESWLTSSTDAHKRTAQLSNFFAYFGPSSDSTDDKSLQQPISTQTPINTPHKSVQEKPRQGYARFTGTKLGRWIASLRNLHT